MELDLAILFWILFSDAFVFNGQVVLSSGFWYLLLHTAYITALKGTTTGFSSFAHMTSLTIQLQTLVLLFYTTGSFPIYWYTCIQTVISMKTYFGLHCACNDSGNSRPGTILFRYHVHQVHLFVRRNGSIRVRVCKIFQKKRSNYN